MSLPSYLKVYDKDDQEIAFGFTNVGWYISSGSLYFSIKETMGNILRYNDGKYYFRQDDWLDNISYIKTYKVKINKQELFQILRGDKKESIAMLEKLME